MMRLMGVISAAVTALVIGLAPIPSAKAAPAMTGTGAAIVRDGVPALTDEVRWRGGGGRGFRGGRAFRGGGYRRGFYRPARIYRPYGVYRPYRPAYFVGGYGYRCFWRPARNVYTPYGWRFVPARRVCR